MGSTTFCQAQVGWLGYVLSDQFFDQKLGFLGFVLGGAESANGGK